MNFFKKNKRFLEKVMPDLARRLEPTSKGTPDIRCFPSREGALTCRAVGADGRWVTLHSTIDPEKESTRLVSQVDPGDGEIVVLVGMGLGYPLWRLMERNAGKQWTVVLVERDLSLFKQSLELFDWSRFFGQSNLHLLVAEEKDAILKHLTRLRRKCSFARLRVITHGPSVRRDPDFYGPLLEQLRLMESSPLGSRLAYRHFADDHLTILLLDSGYFLVRECVKALTKLGHRVLRVSVSDSRMIEQILHHVAQDRPDFLLSVNHLGFDEEGRLTELLEDLRLPFSVWYVDSPSFIIQNFRKNVSQQCVLFLWDRSFLEPMKECGFQRTHFLPLATDPLVFRPMARNAVPALYRNGVSFVGNSMAKAVEDWFGRFPHDSKTEAICRLAVPLQMGNHRLSMADILQRIAETHKLRPVFTDPHHHQNFQAALVWKVTLEYRRKLMQALAPLGIRIFGDDGWHEILNGQMKIYPPVNYYSELPLIFNGTDGLLRGDRPGPRPGGILFESSQGSTADCRDGEATCSG